MEEQEGTVVEVKNGWAVVRVGRHEECTGCGACGAARQQMVEARDELGTHPGTRVRFRMPRHSVALGAFVVFALPLLLAGLGGVLGFMLSAGPEAFFAGAAAQEMALGEKAATIGGAIVGTLVGLRGIKWFDRKVAGRQPYLTAIITH